MNLPSFDEFRQKALAAGFDEVIEREWAPHTVLDTHTHAFGVNLSGQYRIVLPHQKTTSGITGIEFFT
jgi:hypothetical protein